MRLSERTIFTNLLGFLVAINLYIGKIYVLDYQNDRLKLDAPPILEKDPGKLNEKMLSAYNLVGIIGMEETGIFKAYVRTLARFGFRKVAGYKKSVLILQR